MSETKWTSEQLDAITEKDCNLLVAAAAGAGKTAVLVERIIRKITDAQRPVDIDSLLVVTFTNAAATEMRERIAEAISQVLEKQPDSRVIQRQLALLGKSSITTIHSFCMEVIRNHFENISIDPDFRIADETESTLMKLEALNDLFEEQYELEQNPAFFELLECYGGNRDDQTLMDMVLSLYDFIQSSPWPEAWLDEMTQSLDVPEGINFGQTSWGKVLLHSVALELKGLSRMLERAVHLIQTGIGLEKYLPVYLEDQVAIDSLLEMTMKDNSWDLVYHALHDMEFTTLPRAAKEVDKDTQEQVRKIRDDVKARVKKLRERFLAAPSDDIIQDLKRLYPVMQTLSDLVKGLSNRYAEKKSRKSLVDFNDLEHFCLEILSTRDEDGTIRPSKVALGYRDKYSEILVDEYQDSNLVQEMMIRLISRGDTQKPNVFMVGDVKQSIYRFRQARPELFLEKYNTYSSQKGQSMRKILLFKNFRSRKSVVDAVNFIFKQIMSRQVGELDYTEDEALNPGAVYDENQNPLLLVGGEAEIHVIGTNSSAGGVSEIEDEDSGDEAGEEEEILDNIQCEARLVARRIQELLKPDSEGRYYSVWDKSHKTYRKAAFRDIIILLRTTRNWSEVFVEELALMGIPAFADTGSGFFKTVEVQVILSLLQIIDNPLQDIPLLSVLRSPIALFTTDDLAQVRLAERKGPLFNALEKLVEKGEGESSQKAAQFIENLKKWRQMSLYYGTDQLIWRLYDETGYYGIVGAMPAGAQRQANLRILFERARQFEQTSYKGLFNFIHFIDKLKSHRGDMGSAKILSENDNVVRIMSIHKSKGLEFPVVFLSGCGKKFNLQDMNKSILLHQDLGFGPDVVDHKRRISWPSAAKQAIREKIRGETLSEEMRILYVALTRAREKLIITGAVNEPAKAVTRWMAAAAYHEAALPDYEMMKGNTYLDWICPALLRHKHCSGLRDMAPIGTGFAGGLVSDDSQWLMRQWQKGDVLSQRLYEEKDEDAFLEWLDGLNQADLIDSASDSAQMALEELVIKPQKTPDELELGKEIDRRLAWEYGFLKASVIPAKVSVTELKRRYQTQALEEGMALAPLPKVVKKPLFLEEKKGLSGAEKGTILHFVMQHLDLEIIRRINDKQSETETLSSVIASQIEGMAGKDLLTPQQADSVDKAKVVKFFQSRLGQKLLASNSISREIPFNMEIGCSELFRDRNADQCQNETILLQGVIDCFFEEPEGLVLVDYKTDYVAQDDLEVIQERYRLQISYYARALERLTGSKVKEKCIYLFSLDQVVYF